MRGETIHTLHADKIHPFAEIQTDLTRLPWITPPVHGQDFLEQYFEMRPHQVVRVKMNPGVNEFSSVQAAIDSILDASSTKQYVVLVSPGRYIGNIVMKSFVSVVGTEMQSVILEPSDPSNHCVIGASATTLRFCTIKGVTGASKAGVYSTASGFQLRSCVIRDNTINVFIEGVTAIASLTSEDLIITGVFTTGIYIKNSGFGVVGVSKNSIFNSVAAIAGGYSVIIEGASTSFIFTGLTAQGVATVNCLCARNGSVLKSLACEISGFNKALCIEAGGAGPFVDILAANLGNNVIDVHVDHTTATGNISGVITRTKLINNSPNGVQLTYQDPVNGDFNITRTMSTRGFSTESQTLVAVAGTHQLIATDPYATIFTGSVAGQIVRLPDATTLRKGHQFLVGNEITNQLIVQRFDGSHIAFVNVFAAVRAILRDNSTQTGVWDFWNDSRSTVFGTAPFLASFNANALTGRYLEIFPSQGSDTAPFTTVVLSVITAIQLASVSISTGTVGVFKTTDLVNPIASISLVAAVDAVILNLNIIVNANENLVLRVTSGSISKPRMSVYLSST